MAGLEFFNGLTNRTANFDYNVDASRFENLGGIRSDISRQHVLYAPIRHQLCGLYSDAPSG